MKIVTNDYGCGTSSSILDYGTDNVIIVSENNHSHLFDIKDEDLLFVGHDFLMYLWDNERYFKHWSNYSGKKYVWCFEKIDCVVPEWRAKSHYSLSICQHFVDKFYSSDEQDCRNYGITWLPQWASRRFYDQRSVKPNENRLTFSGQSGTVGYEKRDDLMKKISSDPDLQHMFYISNTERNRTWDQYIDNFLNHKFILAPFGNFKGFNTRTYEALTSGRVLLQQVDPEYQWHIDSISKFKNVIFYETFEDLKKILLETDINSKFDESPVLQFEENNFLSRMSSI